MYIRRTIFIVLIRSQGLGVVVMGIVCAVHCFQLDVSVPVW